MKSTITLRIIEVKQKIGTFYISKLQGTCLYQMAKSDIMSISKVPYEDSIDNNDIYEGTQRRLIQKKIESIDSYLDSFDATFPSSVILNIEESRIIKKDINEMEIIVSDDTFQIIDGQHRLQGFREKDYDNFELVVSIFIGLNKNQISRIFNTINKEQTKVNSSQSLYLEIFEETYTPRKVVVNLATIFNSDKKSPWYRMINLLGYKDEVSADGIISLMAFSNPIIDYIYPDEDFYVLRNYLSKLDSIDNLADNLNEEFDYQSKYILWNFYTSQNDQALYKILFNYFISFKKTFVIDWGNSKSLLNKTTGYSAIMYLFKDLYELGYKKRDFTEEFFYSYISKLKRLDGKMNSTNYGASGLKASKDLYNDFIKMLNI